MVQIKKESVRKATLSSAFKLFKKQGYANTTLKQIGQGAGITTTNIYRYFNSKLDILFAVSDPWLNTILDDLERQMDTIDDPRKQLSLIVGTMWITLPEKDNGFHYNLIQAISTLIPNENYSRSLLMKLEARLSNLLIRCLPEKKHFLLSDDKLAHTLMMGSDGFAIGYGLIGRSRRSKAIVEDMCDIIFGIK